MNLKKTVACNLTMASFAGALVFSLTEEIHTQAETSIHRKVVLYQSE